MKTKPPKPKKCKSCGNPFIPQRPLQSVCSPLCGLELTRERNKKKLAQEWKKEKSELKEKLRTKSDYEKDLQKEINTIVRELDKGFLCISTGKPLNLKYDAGHMKSVGSNPTIRFNLFNIYAQSVYANQHLSGDQLNFIEGIEKYYGIDVKEKSLSLTSKYPTLKLSIEDIKEATFKARSIIKWIRLQSREFNATERIELRERFNKELGIYI